MKRLYGVLVLVICGAQYLDVSGDRLLIPDSKPPAKKGACICRCIHVLRIYCQGTGMHANSTIMKTIGIFPASGKLGGSTIRHLLKLVPYNRVVLICRYPEKVPVEYAKGGARVRKAAYEDSPAELEAAFSGIEVLFLISYPSHVHKYRTRVQLPAVDAAYRAGVGHLLYSSLAFGGLAGSNESCAVVMQAHLDTEKHLRDLAKSGSAPRHPFRCTSIREGLYAESVPIYTAFFDPAANPAGDIRIPHDGSGPGVAWAKIDDLGEATARLVAAAAADEQEVQANPDLEVAARYVHATSGPVLLTGPHAWSLEETVARVFEPAALALGQPPAHIQQVSVDEYVSQPAVQAAFEKRTAVGIGAEELARSWATAWDAIRNGETCVVTTALSEILGRKPRHAFAE